MNFARIERDHARAWVYALFDWHPFDGFSPYNPLPIPAAEARIAFITTAGVHLPDRSPFDTDADAGDPTWRAVPTETPLTDLVLSHGGYDTRRASADVNVVLPLDHLRAQRDEGSIGSLSLHIYSIMGYIADTDRLLEVEAPRIAEGLVEDHVDLVLLAPT